MPAFWIELAFAALLLVFVLSWRRLAPAAERFAAQTSSCMVLLAILPVALRLALLATQPAPSPDVYDEFSHLLVADTLRHFRLANPAHALPQFFETFFVLQQPTYSSIYPIGEGLVLTLGRALFGNPWAGVILATAALCSLCYWMLRAWTTPGWSLLGGMLAVMEFGPLCPWMNNYWGGALAAAAGCLVFGALPRLRDRGRWRAGTGRSRPQCDWGKAGGPLRCAGFYLRDAVLLGIGLGMNLLTRPYESIFLLCSVVAFFLPRPWKFARVLAIAAVAVMPFVGVTLLQNRQVTGSWTTLPYTLSQYQYGVPAALTIQPNVVPHLDLTPQQTLDYKMQCAFHGAGTETVGRFFERLEYRVRFYRFFFLAPLYLALPFFLASVRERRFIWVVATLALFALGVNLFPAFQEHYLAAVTCLFVLVSVIGLQRLSRLKAGGEAVQFIVLICVAQFLFWYGLRFTGGPELVRENPRRTFVNRALAVAPGQQLVFVRYSPRHIFQEEWVWNEADIDAARVVWARDLGTEENRKLLDYYPRRAVFLLEPDFNPPRLTAHPGGAGL